MNQSGNNDLSIGELRNKIVELQTINTLLVEDLKQLELQTQQLQQQVSLRDTKNRKLQSDISNFNSFYNHFDELPLFLYIFDIDTRHFDFFTIGVFVEMGYREADFEKFNDFFFNTLLSGNSADFLNKHNGESVLNNHSVLFKITDSKNNLQWMHSELLAVELNKDATRATKLLGTGVNISARIRSNPFIENILRDYINRVDMEKISRLTSRQKQIFGLLAQHKNSQEIANALFISVHTVNKHKQDIKNALGMPSIQAVVSFGIKLGLHLER